MISITFTEATFIVFVRTERCFRQNGTSVTWKINGKCGVKCVVTLWNVSPHERTMLALLRENIWFWKCELTIYYVSLLSPGQWDKTQTQFNNEPFFAKNRNWGQIMGLFMVSQLYYNNWFGRFQANWGELFGAKKILGFLWRRRRNKLFHNEENRQIDKEVSSERTVCVCATFTFN